MISESALLCCHAQKSKAVRPGECIVTGHGFERKAFWKERRIDLRHPIMLFVSVTASALEYYNYIVSVSSLHAINVKMQTADGITLIAK